MPLPDTVDAIPRRLLERTSGLPAFRSPPDGTPGSSSARLHFDEASFPPSPCVLELEMMRSLKQVLDPRGLMNPGKLL